MFKRKQAAVADTLEKAKQKAYRLLALRAHSSGEIEKKLREKGFSAVFIKEALEKLHELKYLNDYSFASQWARNLAVNRNWGNKKIILSLREKGITPEMIEEAVSEARREFSEEEAIFRILHKKSEKKDLTDLKEKRKIFQHLLGRGFPPGLILQKLGKISEDNIHGNEGQ